MPEAIATICCKNLLRAIEGGDIIRAEYEPKKLTVWIYGHPSYANNGDGYTDNTTDSIQISFCPFCGTILQSKT